MAVILRRLALSALLLGAMLVPIFAGGRTLEPDDIRSPESDQLRLLGSRIITARELHVALSERDSALALIPKLPVAADVPDLVLRGFPPNSRAPVAESEIRELWANVSPGPKVRVALITYNAQAYPRDRAFPYSGTLITEHQGSTWCVGVLSVWRVRRDELDVGPEGVRSALAPCLMLARFGQPGSALRPWLESTRYHAARSASWVFRPREWMDGGYYPPWGRHYDPWWLDPGLLLRGFGVRAFLAPRAPPYHLGAPAVRCLGGEAAACAATAFDSTLLASWGRATPRDLTRAFWPDTGQASLLETQPIAPWFLSDLIRDQGPDRFEVFWRSDRPLADAFRDAFEMDMGDWVYRWARRQWEASPDGHYAKRFALGVQLDGRMPIAAVAWTGLFLVVVGWRAQRRTIV